MRHTLFIYKLCAHFLHNSTNSLGTLQRHDLISASFPSEHFVSSQYSPFYKSPYFWIRFFSYSSLTPFSFNVSITIIVITMNSSVWLLYVCRSVFSASQSGRSTGSIDESLGEPLDNQQHYGGQFVNMDPWGKYLM